MERIITAVCVLISLAALGLIALNTLRDPMDARWARLQEEIAGVKPLEIAYATEENINYREIEQTLLAKPSVFVELVPIPPPPPPPPVVPQPPDFGRLKQGVTFTMQGMGSGANTKVKCIHPGNPRGEFLKVGDVVNGMKILEIHRDRVLLEAENDGHRWTTEMPRVRQ